MQFNIEEELKKLPSKPGVYLMHDETDAIIYVGESHFPEKPGASVFSEQPEQGTENRADGHAHCPL